MITPFTVFLLLTAYITYTAYIVFINIVAYTAHTACTDSTAVLGCIEQQGDINCEAFSSIWIISPESLHFLPAWLADWNN